MIYCVSINQLLCPHPYGRAIKRLCASYACLSDAYIRPKSRTEWPRKTKIGTEVAHVTHDSDTTFKVKGQLAGGGAYCGGLPHILLVLFWSMVQLYGIITSHLLKVISSRLCKNVLSA